MKKVYLLFISAIICAGSFAQTVSVYDGAGFYDDFIIGTKDYFVSESIYTNAELGAGSFITAGSAIQRVNFFLAQVGSPTAINNYNIYMKNVPLATTTLATGAYTTVGYTLVFSGTYNATPVGFAGVILTTPFVRTANTNLQVLIERKDNVLHPNYVFEATLGNSADQTVNSSRKYSANVLPVSGTTSLTATPIRPAMQFVHTFPVDVSIDEINLPEISCFSAPQTASVFLVNYGTTNIAAGAASTTLHVRGANNFSGTLTNTAIILPGQFEELSFTGINLSNPGDNIDTAYVTLAGDGTTVNDTLSTANTTATTLSGFPVTETLEEFYPIDVTSTVDVFPYIETIALGNLWFPNHGDYFNTDQTTHLVPLGAPTDSAYYIFDSYSGGNSEGFESRLFSNCIDLSSIVSSPLLTFYMSHDNIFPTTLDSLYVSVSTDKGVTWTRIAGFQRPDVTATSPIWRLESVNLNAYLGQTIQIGFEGVSKYGNAICLDNITINGLLPVSILNFDAQRNGAVNNLTWRTAQESNTNKFIIERSTNGGQTFFPIGQVTAAGNSATERSYSFTDIAPVKGINYYRLRIVDLDNTFKYSIIRNVKNTGNVDFTFGPNPVQQRLMINLNADKADKGFISITDMSGKQVYNSVADVFAGLNNIPVETSRLAQGSYILRLQLSNETVVKKFNKL